MLQKEAEHPPSEPIEMSPLCLLGGKQHWSCLKQGGKEGILD